MFKNKVAVVTGGAQGIGLILPIWYYICVQIRPALLMARIFVSTVE